MTATPVQLDSLPMPAEVAKAYRKYMEDHHGDLSDVVGLATVMYNAGHRVGGQAVFDAMRMVSGIVPLLQDIRHNVDTVLSAIEPEPEQ